MTVNQSAPWPEGFQGEVIFLLDSQSSKERQLLETYVQTQWQADSEHVVYLSLRSEKNSVQNTKAISEVLSPDSDQFYLPLRITWGGEDGGKPHFSSIVDLMLGLRGKGARAKSKKRTPGDQPSYQFVVAHGATLADMQQRFDRKPRDIDMSRYVAKLALLALDRMERGVKGARYKIPRMIDDEVLGRPQLKEMLEEIGKSTGKSPDQLRRNAASCLKEMAATPTPEGLDMAAALGRFMYTRGFDEQLDFLEDDLERIHALLDERPVAFVFTHKSHVDGFLLYTFFHDMNLPPVHTFGGINMGFFGLGAMLRKAGAIFIRRTFGEDQVYKAVFKNYIDYLGEKRFPLMWSLEGTRSRTGKLMPPRFGLINYVISSYLREDDSDLIIMPISIVYDQIPEVFDYDDLQAGGNKRPESAFWFLQYLKSLKNPHGKIHIRFGKGLAVSDYLNSSSDESIDRRHMQKLGFDLAVDVHNVTPITVNSLICYVMLEQGHRAISFSQLTHELDRLLRFIAVYNFPMTDLAENITEDVLHKALDQLSATGVIDVTEEGIDVLYMIPHGGARIAAYYRNGLIQFFITNAIGELALMAVKSTGEKALDELRDSALRIRDLLKYEFFFEGSEQFLATMESQFDQRDSNWRDIVRQGPAEIRVQLQAADILVGHGTLRPFIEAYLVFARALFMAPEDEEVDIKALLKQSQAVGQQGVLQQRIHCEESISQSYFENAVKIAQGRDLMRQGAPVGDERLALFNELLELRASCRIMASIVDSRRYGEIVPIVMPDQ
jgi:glycerol-3-phosphate O-acyltransferase